MCLARAYLNNWESEPAVKDIAHMLLCDRRIELKTLLGEEKTAPGRVVTVDFAASKILIDDRIDAYKSF